MEVIQSILEALHFNAYTAIINLVNVGIVVWVISKYLLPSITSAIQEREKIIEEGILDAQAAKTAHVMAQEKSSEIIATAREEARDIITKSEVFAQQQKENILIEAQETREIVLEKAKSEAVELKNEAQRQLEKEASMLIADLAEKTIKETLSPEMKELLQTKANNLYEETRIKTKKI
jgi:F-type H+-transporting ATPase subunit b